ncbi:MAG: lytic transglycosylase domain-containing protein [Burkholderiaceae bacterium]
MSALVLSTLLAACAPQIHPATASALIAVESAGNPYAIGVVGGALVRQPTNWREAIATARALRAQGWNFSVGLAQINLHNLDRLGLTLETAFDPCANLRAMQAVLGECFDAGQVGRADAVRLRDALSCYYSGNFSTGYRHGYVRKVVLASAAPSPLPIRKEPS